MADTNSASISGGLSPHPPAVSDVEMQNLSKSQSDTANPEPRSSQGDGEHKSVPVPDEGVKDPPAAEASSSTQHDGSAQPDNEDLTIDPVDPAESQSSNGVSTVNIMLQLTNGARHPFRIDEKYLTKRNVTVMGKTEDGDKDPASITVYTLKELILRDWRPEWDEPPREPSSIRLIYFGKLLEDRNPLNHYHFSTTSKNWVHMTVKPQDLLDEEEAAKKVKDSGSAGGRSGCCVIL